ncbi:YrdB family protein [Leucobacter soli]|uniref:DUF2568 domain-containing protein n=1 Tax=Leucobacter soli TaxID=2812850 RepID=A0A916K378_9MICO|nr:YrdB family protein [Leucobacter soli]CAG7618879.1 hypothetical protein LEUCIP111803_02243 [Leucobacter soli]
MNETAPAGRPGQTLPALRGLCHLAAVILITLWALFEWPLPWPGLLAGAGFLVLSIVVWALFLSPRPMLHTDRFGQGLVELLLIAGAVGALLGLGVAWPLALLFGLLAAVLGYFDGARR